MHVDFVEHVSPAGIKTMFGVQLSDFQMGKKGCNLEKTIQGFPFDAKRFIGYLVLDG